MVAVAAVPEPDPDRFNWLVARIYMLDGGTPRRMYVLELAGMLKPWAKHWAGGIADAERRLRRLKAVAHKEWGHEIQPDEIASRLRAALDLLPPSLARVG